MSIESTARLGIGALGSGAAIRVVTTTANAIAANALGGNVATPVNWANFTVAGITVEGITGAGNGGLTVNVSGNTIGSVATGAGNGGLTFTGAGNGGLTFGTANTIIPHATLTSHILASAENALETDASAEPISSLNEAHGGDRTLSGEVLPDIQ